jgi:hypothetical protein
LVGKGPVGAREFGGLYRSYLLEFLPQMQHFVGMALGDLAAEGTLDLLGRSIRLHSEQLIKTL